VLAAELHKYHNYPTLVLADMNATRKLGDSTSGRNMSRALQTIFADFNLIDMWETLHPGLAGHSYFYPKGSSRIDIIYASQHFRQNFNQISTERLIFSDHLMIKASIKGAITTHLVSKFHWKCNESILENPEYILLVNNIWRYYLTLQQYHTNLPRWWINIKKTIRFETKAFSQQLQKDQKIQIQHYYERLAQLKC